MPSTTLAKQIEQSEYQYIQYDEIDQKLHHNPMSAEAATGHIASLPPGIASLPSDSRLNFDEIINKARNAIVSSEKR